MQEKSIDEKLKVLYDLYKDRTIVCDAQKDVEDIRRNALLIGTGSSLSIFALNEFSRLALRSRKPIIINQTALFRLKPWNVLFFAAVPTLYAKYSRKDDINERVENLWRIHQNREEKGVLQRLIQQVLEELSHQLESMKIREQMLTDITVIPCSSPWKDSQMMYKLQPMLMPHSQDSMRQLKSTINSMMTLMTRSCMKTNNQRDKNTLKYQTIKSVSRID